MLRAMSVLRAFDLRLPARVVFVSGSVLARCLKIRKTTSGSIIDPVLLCWILHVEVLFTPCFPWEILLGRWLASVLDTFLSTSLLPRAISENANPN